MNDLKPFLEKLLKLENPWFIDDITFDQERNQDRHLSRLQKAGPSPVPLRGTGGCKPHDSALKNWRHRDLFQYKAYLHARLSCVDCPDHGIDAVKVPARSGG